MADTPRDTRTELSGKRAPAPGATRHAPADTGPDARHKTRADGPVGLNERSGHDVPASPTDMQGSSWLTAAKRTLHEFADDALSDRAAALTYYSVLSIFPGLLVVISLLGLLSQSATQPLITNLTQAAPASVRQIITHAISNLQSGHGAAGFAAIIGIVLALWSASGYIAAFMRAANVVYDVPEGRPFWKTTPLRVGVTLLIMVMLVVSALIVVVTGGLANHVGQVLGIGPAAVTIWNIAKWPVLLLVVVTMFAVLFYAAPNVKLAGFKWVTPGALLAIVLWLVASAAFAFYAANFGSYDKTYGTLGGLVCLLVWMWITNVALLLGMELNSERERSRELDAGVPGADRELQLDARSKPKRQKTT